MGRGKSSTAAAFFALTACASCDPIVTCNGRQAPTWSDCDQLYRFLHQNASQEVPNHFPDCTTYTHPDGVDSHTFNCHFTFCPQSPDVNMTFADVDPAYQSLNMDCKANEAGGIYDSHGSFYFHATNNKDLVPNSEVQTLNERDHARDFHNKRQQLDDDGFEVVVKSIHIERHSAYYPVSGRLPAGSGVHLTGDEFTTVGIGSSVSAGPHYYDVFKDSVGIDTPYDMTVTGVGTPGLILNISCDHGHYGQVYWAPLFTIYSGYYTPSRENAEWYIPEDTRETASNFHLKCYDEGYETIPADGKGCTND